MTYYVLAKKLPAGHKSSQVLPETLKGKGLMVAKFETIKHAKHFIKNSTDLLENCGLTVWKENGTQIKI